MRCFSFDIFDTCLTRLCGSPRNLFDILSLSLRNSFGEVIDEVARKRFVALRSMAKGSNLREIYEDVFEKFSCPFSLEEMVQREQDLERQMLLPIQATKMMVDNLRKKGRILFISDMYLPSSFLREILSKFGFWREGDGLYVSEESHAWKHNGSLYQLIAKQEEISFNKWHHYGDNRHSDYRVPRRLGVHAHLLKYEYLYFEEKWRRLPVLGFQYSSIFAGISRAIRLQSGSSDEQKSIVCNIIAPLLTSWVYRVLVNAKSLGIRRLYFCARDAHTPYLVAQSWSDLFPEIEIRYLYISRKALYDNPLSFDYLSSEGMTDSVPKAIVDVTTSGKTLSVINHWLKDKGADPIRGYYWLTDSSIMEKGNYYVASEIDKNYLYAVAPSYTNRLAGMCFFYEICFSFNRNPQTISYEKTENSIRPVFAVSNSPHDDWICSGLDYFEFKEYHDKLVLAFAEAMRKTGVLSFNDRLFVDVAIRTSADFVSYPQKEYCLFLNKVQLWGRPFVGNMIGRRAGLWHRGSIAYSIPRFMLVPFYALLTQPLIRKLFN